MGTFVILFVLSDGPIKLASCKKKEKKKDKQTKNKKLNLEGTSFN